MRSDFTLTKRPPNGQDERSAIRMSQQDLLNNSGHVIISSELRIETRFPHLAHKNIYKLKEEHKATFYSHAEEQVLPAASTKEPQERGFVVNSGASMHMVKKKDLNSAGHQEVRRR